MTVPDIQNYVGYIRVSNAPRDSQENKIPIAIFPTGALLRVSVASPQRYAPYSAQRFGYFI